MTKPQMDIVELRRALRATLPPETFEPQPMRGVIAWAEAVLMIGLAVFMAIAGLPWWANLIGALILGQMMTSVLLGGHEAMHGSVFKSQRAVRALATVGLLPFLLTPGLWQAWHVQGHHGAPNQLGRDPDRLMDIGAYPDNWRVRMRARMSPGFRNWLSVAALFFMFTLQGHVFLWAHCKEPGIRDRITFHPTRERIYSILLMGAWLTGAILLGWNAFWILVIPLLTSNFTFMAYISTHHWIRPLLPGDDPRISTVSVRAPRILDWWHFGFSYHQEHHFFPRMSHKFGPRLRAKVRELDPGSVAVMPWGEALRAAFTTPALYRDPVTLVHEDGSGAVTLSAIAEQYGLPAFDDEGVS